MIISLLNVFAFVAFAPVPAQPVEDPFGDLRPEGALMRLGSLRDLPSTSQTPVAVMPDGKTIVTGERRGLRFVNVETGKQTDFFPLRCRRVLAIAISPNGKSMAVTVAHENLRDSSASESIYLCDLASKKVVWNRGGIGYSYPQMGFCANGRGFLLQRVDWEKDKRVEVFHCDPNTGDDSTGDLILRNFAISSDGKTIAYGTVQGELFIHYPSNNVSRVADFKPQLIDRMAWSSDARLLALASRNLPSPDKKFEVLVRRMAVIDGTTQKVIFDVPFTTEIKALAFSPDARILGIQASDGLVSTLRFWECATGKELWPALNQSWRLPIPLPLSDGTRFAFQRVASGHILVNAHGPTGKELWRWWSDERLGPAHLVTIGGRQTVISGLPFAIYDIASGKTRADSGGHHQAIRDLQFSPDATDSRLISVDEGNFVRAWLLEDRRPSPSAGLTRSERGAARILRDGTLVFVGLDGSIRIMPIAMEGASTMRITGMLPSRSAFEVTPSGLFAAQTTEGLVLWDLLKGKRLALVNDAGSGRAVRFSPDERYLLTEATDGKTRLYDVSTLPKRIVCLEDDLRFAFTTARFSPDCKWLVGLEKSKLRVVDLADGKTIAQWDLFRDFAFAPTPGVSALAVERIDRSRRLVLLPSGRDLGTLSTGDAPNTLWDSASACTIAMSNENASERIVFSPEGRMFAVAGDKVSLYEAATGKLIGQLPDGHPDGVSALAFSADGRKVATGGREGTILIWDWVAACGLIASPPLTVQSLWETMRHSDAKKAYGAVMVMSGSPIETTAFLRRSLIPAAKGFTDIRTLVDQLDSDSFRKRDAATRSLRLIGSESQPFLRLALSKKSSLEAERRINELLADPQMQTVGQEVIRTIRAIHLLELIGTPEAMTLLRDLANGDPQRIITRAAGVHASPKRSIEK